MCRRILFLFYFCFLGCQTYPWICYAKLNIFQIVEKLKLDDHDYSIPGTLCEQMARLTFETKYKPPLYSVHTGVVFNEKYPNEAIMPLEEMMDDARKYHSTVRNRGELDIVVIKNIKKHHSYQYKAVLIGEVKCWKNASASYVRAIKQRNNFYTYLNHAQGKESDFFLTDDQGIQFTPKQFDRAKYITISYADTKKHGFDFELNYTLNELQTIRKSILAFFAEERKEFDTEEVR